METKHKFFNGSFLTIITVCISVLGSIYIYYLTETSKQAHEDYIRKEARYVKLISSIKGFTVEQENTEMKQNFIDELNLCWLYCPDSVIISAYNFLNTVSVNAKFNEQQKEEALGKLMLEIRKDLISKKPLSETHLTPHDFKLLRPN